MGEQAAQGRAVAPIAAIAAAAIVTAGCSSGSASDASASSGLHNRPPIVDAGEPQGAQSGGLVVLEGAASDPDDAALTFRWRQTSGFGIRLTDPSSAVTSFDAPADVDQASLEFELLVTDSASSSAADTTIVIVNDGYTPCAIAPPREGLGVDLEFYQKYCDAAGHAVLAPAVVPDLALGWVRYQMLEMLKRLPQAAREMIRNGSQVTVKDVAQRLTEIPEYANLYALYPEYNWDALPGVGAVIGRPVTSTSVENVLCFDDDPYRGFSVFIHEFAHAIHLIGLAVTDPTFEPRLIQAYETAMASGLWADAYSAENYYEYWAEGVAIWYDAHWSTHDLPGVINTRASLAQYDDALYRLVEEYFSADSIALCPADLG